jgi:succinoglycan biosynthesis protein ExoA
MRQAGAIAIAVPTLNEAAGIADVVSTLLAGVPADRDVRLYVADGGSTDATRAIVASIARTDPRVILLPNPDRLQSAAINRVAADAAGWADILIRADAHAGYPDGFVARVVDAIGESDADSVVVPMDSVGSSCMARAIAWVSDTRIGSGGSAHRGGRASGWVDHGHHAGWRLTRFVAAGGYDASYSHNEDAELDCRIARGGGRIWLDAGIRLDYHVRTSLRALWQQYHNYGRGRSRTVRRHPGSMRARQLAVPAFVGANLVALLAAPVLPLTLLLPAAYALILAASSVQVALKRRSACGLLVGAAAAVMHVAWAAGFAEGMLTIREKRWPGPEEALA